MTSNFELRQYQKEAIDFLSKAQNSSLFVIPMGGGKTECFLSYAKKEAGKKILCLFDRIKLAEQTYLRARDKLGMKTSLICSSEDVVRKKDQGISELTMSTILSAGDIDLDYFDVIIIDEVHVAFGSSKSYKEIFERAKCPIFGFTATPYNARGVIFGEDKYFKTIDFYVPFSQLLDEKIIVPIRNINKDEVDRSELKISKTSGDYSEESIEGQLITKMSKITIDAISRSIGRKKVAVWCGSINIANEFKQIANSMGHKCGTHHSLHKDDIEEFEKGDLQFLSFVNIISTGYDFPPLDTLICLRPTQLPHLWVQTAGRISRKCNNKFDGLILDYSGNIREIGHPYSIDPWKIAKYINLKEFKEKEEKSYWECRACCEVFAEYQNPCPSCGNYIKPVENLDEVKKEKLSDVPVFIYEDEQESIESVNYYRVDDYITAAGKHCIKLIVNGKTLFYRKDLGWSMQNFNKHKKMVVAAHQAPSRYDLSFKKNDKGFWNLNGVITK